MESSNLKNMVVLKNVPSNMIEEAMIVLKKNIKIKETELQNCIENEINKNTKKDITNIENNKKKEIINKKINRKYKKMKKYLYITSILCIIEMIFIFIK